MRYRLRHNLKEEDPVKGCVAYHSHGILSTDLTRGSYNLFSPQYKSNVLNVVWGKINKSVQRLTT